MNGDNGGKTYFGLGLNNSQLRADALESQRIFKNVGDHAVAEGARIDNTFNHIGRTLATVGGTLAVGSLAKDLYNFSGSFEKSMLEVSTISQTVTDNMAKFKQEIIDLTTKKRIPVYADEAAKSLYQIVSAGRDGAAGLNILQVSAKSAVGGITETTIAADAITTMLNAYKMDASDAEKVSDQLFTTVRLGKTTFSELGHHIAQAVPVAAAYGVEMDQVLAAIATLTKSGTPTAQAVTQVRASIIGVSKVLGDGAFETRTFQEALNEVAKMAGGSEARLRELMPEVEAITGLLGLTGEKASVAAQDLAELGNSAGATDEAFNKMRADGELQFKLLKNNIFAEFSELGDGMRSTVNDLVGALNRAFDSGSIHEVIDMLRVLIATYGTYKATLLAVAAIQKVSVVTGNIRAWLQLAKSIRSAEDAQIAFNLATKANPYILLASAIVGVVTAFTLFHKNANKAAEASAELSTNIQQEKKELDGLFEKLDQAKTGTNERKKALEAINGKYGSYLDNLLTEKSTVEEVAKAYQEAKKSVIEFEVEKSRNKYLAEPTENLNDATKDFYVVLDKWAKKLENDTQRGKFKSYVDQIIEAVKGGEHFSIGDVEDAFRASQSKGDYKNVQEWLEAFRAGKEEFGANVLDKIGGWTYGALDRAGNMVNVYSGSLKKAEEEFAEFSKAYTAVSDPGPTDGSKPTKTIKSLADQTEAARKNVEKLKVELQALREGKDMKAGEDYTQLAKRMEDKATKLKDAEAVYKTLKGKLSEEEQKAYEGQESLRQKIIDNDLALQNDRLAVLREGRIRQLAEIDLEEQEKLKAVDREQKELEGNYKKLGKGSLSEEEKKKFDDRRALISQGANQKRFEAEYQYNIEIEQLYESLTDVFLTEEEKKRKAVQQRYDEMRKAAREEYDNEVFNIYATKTGEDRDRALQGAGERQKQKLTMIDAAQDQEMLKDLLEQYKTYSARRLEIEAKFNADRNILESSNADRNGEIEELERQRQEELDQLDLEVAGREESFSVWADRVANLGLKKLLSALQTARNALNNDSGLDDKEKAILRAKIVTLERKVKTKQAEDSESTSSEKSKKKWNNTLKVMNEVQSTVDNIVESFEGFDDVTKTALTAATNIAGGVIAMITGIQMLSTASAEGIKTVERASVILAIIGAAVQILTAIFSLSSKADKEHREALKKVEEERIKMQREYNSLLREQNSLLAEAETIFGRKTFAAGIGLVKQYQQAISELKAEMQGDKAPQMNFFERISGDALGSYAKKLKEYEKGVYALSNVKIKTGSYTTGAWFWKKQHDIMTSVLEVYPDLVDAEGNMNKERLKSIINTHEMSDSDKELLQTLLDLTEEAEDALQALKDNIAETWGELGQDLVDSVVNAVENGEDAVEAFTKSIASKFRKLGQDLMYELYFADMFKKLEEDMVNTYKNNSNPADIVEAQMDLVDDFFSSVSGRIDDASKFYQNFLDKMKESGYSIENEREASAKGIATASQESVDENNGRLTVIQSHTYSLSENMKILIQNSAEALRHLAGIKNDTSRLEKIESVISEMKTEMSGVKYGIDTINMKGVKFKS